MTTLPPAPPGGENTSAARKIVEAVRSGKCILFLGAGVHYPPPGDSPYEYPEEQRPPLGGALARALAEQCDFKTVCPHDSESNLQRVSLCYETRISRRALVAEIHDRVESQAKPSAAVRALAELPFPLVITTNYDTLFERALRRADKDPLVGVYEPRSDVHTDDLAYGADPTVQSPFLFKVHGDIKRPESIVVTDEDYIGFVLRMNAASSFHPIPETFRYYLLRWPTLFIGYSLLDYNLRLLFRTLRWQVDEARHPESYSVDYSPDPLISQVWQRHQSFRFIVEDVWDFVPHLYRDVLDREMPE